MVKSLSHLTHMPAVVKQSNVLPSVSALILRKQCPFCSLLSATFLIFLWGFLLVILLYFCGVFLLVILLSKLAPKHSAEVLSSVPEHKKAVMCLMEKI